MNATNEELDALVTKIDSNLPSRREAVGLGSRELYKLELTLRERALLGEALRRMLPTRLTDWQSIEAAPMDGTFVDLWIEAESARFRATDYRWRGTTWEHKHGGTLEDNFSNVGMQATHWCSIPAAPSRKT